MNMLKNNRYLEFKFLYSLIGKDTNDPDVKNLLDYVYNECIDYFVIQEPSPEEILSDNDKWKCYDSEELGLVFEIVNEVFACVSFFSNVLTYNGSPEKRTPYPYSLLKDLTVNSGRDEVRRIFGSPQNPNKKFDRFSIDEKITMGVIYNDSSGLTAVISYGATAIFSNPAKTPNRFSLIFWSLT